MGCWLDTCFVSHLPIGYGVKCRLFILEHTDGWKGDRVSAGFCYPHDVWAPCSFALPGVYDDYGRVTDIKEDSLEARLAMEHVRERVVENPVDEDGEAAEPVVKADLTTFSLQEAIAEGRGRFKDYRGRVQPFGLVMVRDDVYRAIVRKGFTSTWRTPKRFTTARFVRQGEALVAALRVKAAAKALETEPWKRMMFSSDIEFVEYEGKKQEYDLPNFFTHNVMEFRDHLGNHLVKMVETNSPDIPRFLRLTAEHLMFSCYLSSLRRAWMPQPGKGSQDESYEDHAWLAKLVGEVAARELARTD